MQKKLTNVSFWKFILPVFLFLISFSFINFASAEKIIESKSNDPLVIKGIINAGTEASKFQFLTANPSGTIALNALSFPFNAAKTISIFNYNSTGSTTLEMLDANLNYNKTSGFIGIGTTNPGAKLDIVGALRATNATITLLGNSGDRIVMTDNSGNLYATSSASIPGLPVFSPTNATSGQTLRFTGTLWEPNSIIFNNGTNVGIGTTSPGQKLDVNGVITAKGFRVDNIAGAAGNYLRSNGTNLILSTIQAADVPTLNQNTVGYSSLLVSEDNRSISPAEVVSSRLKFGFTSYNNNNSAPWSDFIHMRSYQDASGGNDNLIVFNKTNLGARLYQQDWGTTNAYSSYKDIALSDNSPSLNYVTKYTVVGNNVSIGNSLIYDNGINVGIGTTAPGYKLDVDGGVDNQVVDVSGGRIIGLSTIPLTATEAVSRQYLHSHFECHQKDYVNIV